MSRKVLLNNISTQMVSGETKSITLTRAFILHSVTLNFTVNHTNTQVIAGSVAPLTFITKVLKNFRFEAGAGSDIINLNGVDLGVRQLLDIGALTYDIDKTVGASVSTFSLIIPIYNFRGINPKDTLLDTLDYEHINIIPTIGDFDSFTESSLDKVTIDVTESQKSSVKPLMIKKASGATVPAPKKNRKPITVTQSFTSDESNFSIELPKRSLITGVTLYCVENGVILDNVINKLSVKIIQNLRFTAKSKNLNNENRLQYLQSQGNSNFNGIYHIDFANGEEAEAINTSLPEENYGEIILDLTFAGTSPTIVALFETIELQ